MPRELPTISPTHFRWFTWYGRRFVAKHFHALRVARASIPPTIDAKQSLIIAMNHPSWWDPMIALVLADCFFPQHRHFAPIDAAMLERYRFFRKLGFFGVDSSSSGGAAFLRTSLAIVSTPGTCLWITAQGQFTDPRERPIRFAAGLPRLLEHASDSVKVIPLAMEFPFWTERDPEALVRFGPPCNRTMDPADALTRAMDELAADAIAKDSSRFEIALGGASGSSAIYDAWRRFKHWASGERSERFSVSHMEDVRS